MPLTPEQKQAIKEAWDIAPSGAAKQQLMAFARDKGIPQGEFEEVISGAPGVLLRDLGPIGREISALMESIPKGASMGLMQAEPPTSEQRPFEFDIPYLAEKFPSLFKGVSPSRAVGETIGLTTLPLQAAGWIGEKALRLSPVVRELAAKGIPLSRLIRPGAAKASEEIFGFAALEAAKTYAQTGDLKKADEAAAMVVMLGVPAEVALRGIAPAIIARIKGRTTAPEVQAQAEALSSAYSPEAAHALRPGAPQLAEFNPPHPGNVPSGQPPELPSAPRRVPTRIEPEAPEDIAFFKDVAEERAKDIAVAGRWIIEQQKRMSMPEPKPPPLLLPEPRPRMTGELPPGVAGTPEMDAIVEMQYARQASELFSKRGISVTPEQIIEIADESGTHPLEIVRALQGTPFRQGARTVEEIRAEFSPKFEPPPALPPTRSEQAIGELQGRGLPIETVGTRQAGPIGASAEIPRSATPAPPETPMSPYSGIAEAAARLGVDVADMETAVVRSGRAPADLAAEIETLAVALGKKKREAMDPTMAKGLLRQITKPPRAEIPPRPTEAAQVITPEPPASEPTPSPVVPSEADVQARIEAEVARRVAEAEAQHPPVVSTPVKAPATPVEIGRTVTIPVADLNFSPDILQYKLIKTGQRGSTGTIPGKFNPELSSVISVWRDPEGKVWVVNGHNRADAAIRSGVQDIDVKFINAPDAQTARFTGAMQNIAEGQGTALDAAKLFKDTGITDPAQLAEHGINLKKRLAADGLALSRLNPTLFQAVFREELDETLGVIIGERVPDVAGQTALLREMNKAAARGKKLTPDVVREMADMVSGAPTMTQTQETLFGTETTARSVFAEMAEVAAHIRRELSATKKIFSMAAREKAAERLQAAGNVIDAATNKVVSQEAAVALEFFDRLKTRSGPIADIINDAALQLAEGKNASTVKADAYNRVRESISAIVEGADTGRAEGVQGVATGPPRPGGSGAAAPNLFGGESPIVVAPESLFGSTGGAPKGNKQTFATATQAHQAMELEAQIRDLRTELNSSQRVISDRRQKELKQEIMRLKSERDRILQKELPAPALIQRMAEESRPIQLEQIQQIGAMLNHLNADAEQTARILWDVTGKPPAEDLSFADGEAIIDHLTREVSEGATRRADDALRTVEAARTGPPAGGEAAAIEGRPFPEGTREVSPGSVLYRSPSSRWNIGGTPQGRVVVDAGMEYGERLIKRDTGEYFTRLNEKVFKPLNPDQQTRVAATLDGKLPFRNLTEPEQAAAREARVVMDEIADALGLPKGRRLSFYFPHIFRGRLGQLLAEATADQVGIRLAEVERVAPVADVKRWGLPEATAHVPQEKLFRHLFKRTGAEGYEYDLAQAMYSYVVGGVRKVHLDKFLDIARQQIDATPPELVLKKRLADYAYYVVGGNADWPRLTAAYLRDSKLFNGTVDRMVEWFAPNGFKGALAQSPQELAEWYTQLVTEARRGSKGAEVALALDEFRTAATDPRRAGRTLGGLYRAQAWLRLGLNVAHGITNLTQTISNTYPLLGEKWTARGVSNYLGYQWGGRKLKIGDVYVGDLLKEISHETIAPEEFLLSSKFSRGMSRAEEIIFAPSRISERFNRGVALLGQYEKSIARGKGHAEALREAIGFVHKTQFVFGKAGTPDLLRNPFLRLALMFKSYAFHQVNFSSELLADAIKGGAQEKTAFARHLAFYLVAIGGASATGLNIAQRFEHPAMDIARQFDPTSREPILVEFGGPYGAFAYDVARAIMSDKVGAKDVIIRNVMPSQASRMLRAQERGESVPLAVVGLRRTQTGRTRKRQQRERVRQ